MPQLSLFALRAIPFITVIICFFSLFICLTNCLWAKNIREPSVKKEFYSAQFIHSQWSFLWCLNTFIFILHKQAYKLLVKRDCAWLIKFPLMKTVFNRLLFGVKFWRHVLLSHSGRFPKWPGDTQTRRTFCNESSSTPCLHTNQSYV